MVRVRAKHHFAGHNVMQPRKGAANQVNTGSQRTVTFTPREAAITWVTEPPNIRNTTVFKEGSQSLTTFTREVRNIRTSAIESTVEHSIKITTEKGRHTRVDYTFAVSEEVIPFRISVGGINACQPEGYIMMLKLSHDKTTI